MMMDPTAEWERVEGKPGWIHLDAADVHTCPKCWAPVAILSHGYDWDGREDHRCGPRNA